MAGDLAECGQMAADNLWMNPHCWRHIPEALAPRFASLLAGEEAEGQRKVVEAHEFCLPGGRRAALRRGRWVNVSKGRA